MVTRVKICGITRAEDAEWAIECGADALGFVFERSSTRYIGDRELKWISALPPIPPKIAVFGKVDRAVHKGLFDVVQGVEWQMFPEPSPKRIHVVRLRPGQRAKDITDTLIHASAILLDAYREGQWGGTGHTVDWDQAAEIVQESHIPIILAGGLDPENVRQAISIVRPFAVDVSSGVESEGGIKDRDKVKAFIEAAKSV